MTRIKTKIKNKKMTFYNYTVSFSKKHEFRKFKPCLVQNYTLNEIILFHILDWFFQFFILV